MTRRFSLTPLVLLAAGCSGPTADAPSAVLVTIDTWRADSFGAGGHPTLRTPHLDRLFRGGVQFSEAFSPIPTTLASHVSILTGTWPPEHGVPRNIWRVPDDLTSIAEIVRAKGIATGAFVSAAVLEANTNIGQGFDPYDDDLRGGPDGASWRFARATVERAQSWWRGTRGRKFLWLHVFEPHLPYRPAPEYAALYAPGPGRRVATTDEVSAMWKDKSRFTDDVVARLRSLYWAEISGMDRQLGGFLRELVADPGVAVIVTADHGESIGDHNLFFKHGPKVFPSDVRVPLLLRHATVQPGVSRSLVRTIDIPRTLLGLLGISAELPLDAEDLRDWTDGGGGLTAFGVASAPADAPPEIFVDGAYANVRMPRVIRRGDATYMESPWQDRRVCFDRGSDPDELWELRPAETPESERLKSQLDAWVRGARVLQPGLEMDPELEARMRALGYVN